MTIGLVVCAYYVLRSDRVSVFNACGHKDMFDEVGVQELAAVAISVGSLDEYLDFRREA